MKLPEPPAAGTWARLAIPGQSEGGTRHQVLTATRVIRNVEALREQLSADLPAKDAESHLLTATWNVRDLYGRPEGAGRSRPKLVQCSGPAKPPGVH
jgi:hypothetical protein